MASPPVGEGDDDGRLEQHTSGTTGPPKGVELTHRNVLTQLEATSARLGLTVRMRVISYYVERVKAGA
jgi:long-subunit acyl-CoA synthetase (AMP-forming)